MIMLATGLLSFKATDKTILPFINVDTTACVEKGKSVVKMGRTCLCKCTCTCVCQIKHK